MEGLIAFCLCSLGSTLKSKVSLSFLTVPQHDAKSKIFSNPTHDGFKVDIF